MPKIKASDFRFDGTGDFKIKKADTKIKDIYDDKADYEQLLAGNIKELDELQNMMYAHDRYGLLVIFQALDAAGKDGTIRAVFSGVNPAGMNVVSFKRPTELELEHDYLWRTQLALPQRGTITVFNRSYYEEVLVVKVHPGIVTDSQRIPVEFVQNLDKLWKNRYEDISNMEQYLYRNGIRIVKFFLNISKEEQADRLIERIEDPSKNWKFEEGDLKERALWDEYMDAFETCINKTASKEAPWYIIPADDKKNMRLLVGSILIDEMKKMDMQFPEVSAEQKARLQGFVSQLRPEA